MLRIVVPAVELWDEEKQEFTSIKETTLELEHSLLSLVKWESKWNKAFLGNQSKTQEEVIDYVRCMILNRNVDPDICKYLTNSNIDAINAYIEAPMTATTFTEEKNKKKSREIPTNELIYYWMIAHNIPFDPCEKWHLNRLMTLIRVCNVKNSTPTKRSRREIMEQNTALNAARKKKLNTKG